MCRPCIVRIQLFFAALAAVAYATPVHAQRTVLDSVRIDDSTVVHAITLTNGSRIVGRIRSVTPDSVRIVSSAVSTTVARSTVREVRQFPATAMRNGELWLENPHATRLIFAPTGIPLRKGEGYFADFWIFLLSTAVGVTDKFTIGGGMTLIPGLSIEKNVFYLLPKYTVVDRPSLKFAVGALAAHVGVSDDDAFSPEGSRSLGVLYGVATTGSRERNLSLGAGWGYVGGTLEKTPVITLGGQHRVSRRIVLISDNWILPFDGDASGVISYGIRFIGEKIAVDLALANSPDDFIFPGIPLLGFAIKY
jgi:hypothetical protein